MLLFDIVTLLLNTKSKSSYVQCRSETFWCIIVHLFFVLVMTDVYPSFSLNSFDRGKLSMQKD